MTTLICRANYSSMDSLIGFLVDECCADVRENPLEDDTSRLISLFAAKFYNSGNIGEG